MVKFGKKLKHSEIQVSKLIPYARNSRTHTDDQIKKVAASIKEFGFLNPVITDGDNGIIAGHCRVQAAELLGMDKVPCVEAGHLTKAQRQAYVIADNKLALDAGWNEEMLRIELTELHTELDFDIEITGFTLDDLNAMIGDEAGGWLTDEDAVPDVPVEPVNVLGDVWTLGNHSLMCGDSTSIDAVENLMDGKKADMVFTSPPYNADTKTGDGDIFNKKKGKKLYSEGYSDNLSNIDYIDFVKAVLEICFMVVDGFIFWNVSYNSKSKYSYIQQIQNRVEYLVEQVCWKKSSTIPFKGCLMREWEPIYIFSTNKQNLGVKEVSGNYWQISNRDSQQEDHKACFPVALPEKGISLVSSNSGIVFDPFGGSGSTLIACEKTNRNCYMMEIAPNYCDVIINRWQAYTGKKASHENGQTFDDLKAERDDRPT